jgi:hypothetical protein
MMRMAAVVLVLAAGCGDDDCCTIDAPPSGGACGTNGTGIVNGTVLGVDVTPVMRASQVIIQPGIVGIVIDEQLGATCKTPATSGDHLVLYVCDPVMAQTYPVMDPNTIACPSSNAAALVEHGGGADVAFGTGGTVLVTGASGTCTIGSFTVDFGSESFTGTFDAVVCP